MVGLRRVEQQQRVARRRGVEHDELVLRPRRPSARRRGTRRSPRCRASADLLRAGAPAGVERRCRGREHLVAVRLRFGRRIDARHAQAAARSSPTASATCAAGSVVLSSDVVPARARGRSRSPPRRSSCRRRPCPSSGPRRGRRARSRRPAGDRLAARTAMVLRHGSARRRPVAVAPSKMPRTPSAPIGAQGSSGTSVRGRLHERLRQCRQRFAASRLESPRDRVARIGCGEHAVDDQTLMS